MKTKLLIVLLLSIMSINSQSQNIFQKTDTSGGFWGVQTIPTRDNGYVVLSSFLTQQPYSSKIIKLNYSGDTLWSVSYNHAFTLINQTLAGGYILSDGTGNDTVAIKTDAAGNILWAKSNIGWVKQAVDSGFYFGGGKLDNNGNVLWAKQYSASPPYSNISGFIGFEQTMDKGYILAGSISKNNFSSYPALLKTDSLGNVMWSRYYSDGSTYPMSTITYSAIPTPDSGYIVFNIGDSATYGPLSLIKTNSNGNVMWSRKYNTGGLGFLGGTPVYPIVPTAGGGYILINTTVDGNHEVCLIKTKANGDTLWTKKYGIPNYTNEFNNIAQTFDRGFITAGLFTDNTTTFGSYIIKTDSTGFSGGCFESSPDIRLIPYSVTDSAFSVTSLTALPQSYTISANILNSATKLTTLCSVIASQSSETELFHRNLIYPNPFDFSTLIKLNVETRNAELNIYNSFGQKVKQLKNISGQTILFHRDNLGSGLYFIRLTQDNKLISEDKFIIAD